MTGCNTSVVLENPYDVTKAAVISQENSALGSENYFASNLCVGPDENIGLSEVHSEVAEAAGVFNLNTKKITYSQNIYEQLFPASTTKILTAYIIIKNCSLGDYATVSSFAATQASDSSVCGLKEGDIISIKDLLYGLMLASGNDAAIVLAEYYSGSCEAFAEVMNQTALGLGCTGSHFVNPNGMPDDNHYTTVYDMYLIFQEAIKEAAFQEMIGCKTYNALFTSADGKTITKTWTNTNRFINGQKDSPNGFTVIGGKTGTTGAAGYCLVMYSKNASGEDIVSIVFKAGGPSDLYLLMSEILAGFGK